MENIRVALDVASGEGGYRPHIEGAITALKREKSLEVVLVGYAPKIHETVIELSGNWDRLSIHNAPEVITMEMDDVKAASRMTESSLYQTFFLAGNDQAHAAVSAGNSPVFVLLARQLVGIMNGVKRPAFVFVCPTPHGDKVFMDGGANKVCTPRDHAEFGIMGQLFAYHVLGIKKAHVGLIAIGEERHKAMPIVNEALEMLTCHGLPYGTVPQLIEPDKFFSGNTVHVGVTDGLIGNLILKTGEGILKATGFQIKEFIKSKGLRALFLSGRKTKAEMKRHIYPPEYAHAHWWGGNKDLVKVHGGCDDPEIFCEAVLSAHRMVASNVIINTALVLSAKPELPRVVKIK